MILFFHFTSWGPASDVHVTAFMMWTPHCVEGDMSSLIGFGGRRTHMSCEGTSAQEDKEQERISAPQGRK